MFIRPISNSVPNSLQELADVAHEVGARVMYDGAHVLGLIAGGNFKIHFGRCRCNDWF